jgi:hypothetical protein
MQSLRPIVAAVLALVVSTVVCGGPPLAQAQQAAPSPPTAPAPGSSVDPAQGPLEPVPPSSPSQSQPQPLPDAPSAPLSQPMGTPQAPPVPMANAPQTPSEPVGTATAERAPTAGGAASKPAGTAIAPAKQRQVRSLLIKLGAVAGAGVALGTVAALSKGSPSTPSNASRASTGH